MMNGEIGLISTPGQGSTFWFTLTLTLATHPVDASPPAIAVAMQSRQVLLVEDNTVNQLVAQKMLHLLGCQVDTANNGLEALAALAERHYDLVLMDCQMPELDGFETTQRIRRQEAAQGDSRQRLPIIALTANAMQGDRERCLAAGMDDYISKPFNQDQLRALLLRTLPLAEPEPPAAVAH